MGLPVLTLKNELAIQWQLKLQENGLALHLDYSEIEKQNCINQISQSRNNDKDVIGSKWIETPWIICNKDVEIKIIELTTKHHQSEEVSLVFLPVTTKTGRLLYLRVNNILIALGATKGKGKGVGKG